MKVEFDMPIAIGDTIYTIERHGGTCCGCPKASEVKDGICESNDGICNVYRIKPIVVDKYYPYVMFDENNEIKLSCIYYKTKEEAIAAAKKQTYGFYGFNGSYTHI